jgi:hypothetical protein
MVASVKSILHVSTRHQFGLISSDGCPIVPGREPAPPVKIDITRSTRNLYLTGNAEPGRESWFLAVREVRW